MSGPGARKNVYMNFMRLHVSAKLVIKINIFGSLEISFREKGSRRVHLFYVTDSFFEVLLFSFGRFYCRWLNWTHSIYFQIADNLMCFIVSVVVVVFRFFLFLVSAFKLREMILLNNITWLICVLFSFLFDLLLFKNRFPSLTAHSQQIPKMPQVGTEWPRERIERQSKMMNKWRSKWSITKWNVALVFRTLVFFSDRNKWSIILIWYLLLDTMPVKSLEPLLIGANKRQFTLFEFRRKNPFQRVRDHWCSVQKNFFASLYLILSISLL